MPKLLTRASYRKDWKRISAELSLMSPPTTQSVKGLTWTELVTAWFYPCLAETTDSLACYTVTTVTVMMFKSTHSSYIKLQGRIFWLGRVPDKHPTLFWQCRCCHLPTVSCWSCRWLPGMRSAWWSWCSTLRTMCSRSGLNPGSSSTGSSTICEHCILWSPGGRGVGGGWGQHFKNHV